MTRALIALSASLVLGATAAPCLAQGAPAGPLLQTSQTVVGEDLVYPATGKAVVTTTIVTLAPGETTITHQHGVPMIAYILEGELTVDYGDHGTKTYTAGESFAEAMRVDHAGTNTGTGTLRILSVYVGAEGSRNVIPKR
ncbi:MAG: cupin domain-containing protein [Vicinamibacterales bacterium]